MIYYRGYVITSSVMKAHAHRHGIHLTGDTIDQLKGFIDDKESAPWVPVIKRRSSYVSDAVFFKLTRQTP